MDKARHLREVRGGRPLRTHCVHHTCKHQESARAGPCSPFLNDEHAYFSAGLRLFESAQLLVTPQPDRTPHRMCSDSCAVHRPEPISAVQAALESAGITPDDERTYETAAVSHAIGQALGTAPALECAAAPASAVAGAPPAQGARRGSAARAAPLSPRPAAHAIPGSPPHRRRPVSAGAPLLMEVRICVDPSSLTFEQCPASPRAPSAGSQIRSTAAAAIGVDRLQLDTLTEEGTSAACGSHVRLLRTRAARGGGEGAGAASASGAGPDRGEAAALLSSAVVGRAAGGAVFTE